MIDRKAILAYAREMHTDPFWIENDYLQHIALAGLYSAFSNELIFKGGTALQKLFGLNRLSRDLDFNLLEGDPLKKIRRAAARIGDIYDCAYKGPSATKHGAGFTLLINGPSYGDTGIAHPLPVTMNTQEKPELKPLFKTVNPGVLYKDPDLRAYSLLVMSEEEMLAEKVRAVLTRNGAEPRDIYDIWFLLNSGVAFNIELSMRKTEFDHGTFSASAFKRMILGAKGAWEADLGQLVRPLPAYDEVADFIRAKLLGMWPRKA